MPQLNVYWKGYPHRRLPRIRVDSLGHDKGRSYRQTHGTAEETLQLSLGLALEKARLQQRTRIRREDRNSRGILQRISTSGRVYPIAVSAQGNLDTKVQDTRNLEAREKCSQGSISSCGRSRMYDPRLPIRRARRRTKSTRTQLGSMEQSPCSIPVLKQSIKQGEARSSTAQAMSGSASRLTSTEPVSPSKPLSGLFSRTRRQQVALKNFRRGLERHLIAQEAVRKACLSVSSSSSSTLSANTVVEFVPYLAEFQAAGLAVTSAQQRRPANRRPNVIPRRVCDGNAEENVQTLSKGDKQMENGQAIELLDGSDVSFFTNTTSSRTNMIAFSTLSAQNSIVTHPNRKTTVKRPLPWLHQDQSSFHSTPTDRVNVTNNMKSSSGSTCDTCATTIIDFSPVPIESKRKQNEPDNLPIGHQPSDVKYIDTDNSFVGSARPQSDKTYVGKSPRTETAQSSQTPKPKLRTTVVPVGPESRRKGKHEFHGDDPVPQSSRKTLSPSLNATSIISVGPFRASPKLLAQEPTSNSRDTESTSLIEDATAIMHKKTLLPARPPPSVPARNSPSTSELAYESQDPPIRGPYDFEAPSIFEQALNDVVTHPCLTQNQPSKEQSIKSNLSFMSSIHQGNCDPVKRRSTSYMPSEPSSRECEESLGFAMASNALTMTSKDHSKIRNKDVLKGLQVALAAACDESVDSWITRISGYQVRKFLADLRAFEGLGVNTLTDEAIKTAKKRRKEPNRRTRENEDVHVHDQEKMLFTEMSEKRERKGRGMAADNGRRGLLIAEILGRRDTRAGEGMNERALGMGWRHRSVSAGY